jgi:Ca2+-binding EF-hand superfamily protein
VRTFIAAVQDGDIDFREFIVGLSSWESNEPGFGRLRFAFKLLDNVRFVRLRSVVAVA